MNFGHLDTLIAVIDEGSFDGAASALGISPSAVSQRIKNLELSAGRVLLRRTSPPTATEAGEILVQTARRRRLLEAEATAQLEGQALTMPLSVVVNADSLGTWFSAIFRDASAGRHTGLRIWIEDERHSLATLKRGDCLGVVTTEARAVPGCDSEYLGVQRYRPVGSPGLAADLREGRYGWADLPAVRFGSKDLMEAPVLAAHLGERGPA
ncbi:ArgP/LysG family DNA-binding transcriptional regulator, partial [Corynebacterium heidelbergense]